MTTPTLKHVAGSSFGLLLHSADQCPISDATLSPLDTGDWGTELVFVSATHRFAVSGLWISSFEPWTLSFQKSDTKAWPAGSYEVRLAYITPENTEPRRFESALGMSLEVSR